MASQRGFTLLELIVVVGIIAVLAGVSATPLTQWNCKRRLQADFGDLQGLYGEVRSLALSRRASVMLAAESLTSGGYQFRWGASNRTCTASPSSWLGASLHERASFSALDTQVCFHGDQSATGTGFTLSSSCGGTTYQYRLSIIGATGYTLSERKVGDQVWEEL